MGLGNLAHQLARQAELVGRGQLALAVGIVLGAGPLQGQIGDTLTAEITQLRSDKASLRTQVTGLEQTTADQSAFEQATLRRVVAGVASGRGVAIVSLPGAEADVATAIADTVVAAGGTVASRTTLDASWVALDDATIAALDIGAVIELRWPRWGFSMLSGTLRRVIGITYDYAARRCDLIVWGA